jgi:hypothetical protein
MVVRVGVIVISGEVQLCLVSFRLRYLLASVLACGVRYSDLSSAHACSENG